MKHLSQHLEHQSRITSTVERLGPKPDGDKPYALGLNQCWPVNSVSWRTALQLKQMFPDRSPSEGHILPDRLFSAVAEDGEEKAVVWFYTDPAHFQVIWLFERRDVKTGWYWFPVDFWVRKLRNDKAEGELPEGLTVLLGRRVRKRQEHDQQRKAA